MIAILEFGTLWFWVFCFAIAITLTALTEKDETEITLSGVVFVGSLVALWFLGCKEELTDIGSFIYRNPGTSLLVGVGYVILGVIWSFVKWYFYLVRMREVHQDTSYPEHYFDVNRNKSRIMTWMIYWPLSGAWTLINDPIKKLYRSIFEWVGGSYQKMSDKMTANMKFRLEKAEEERLKAEKKAEKKESKLLEDKK
jgi:hypothetical protein